ncbi:MAG: hypothetical protein RLZZ298_41 [Pseudomonadota bacterium]
MATCASSTRLEAVIPPIKSECQLAREPPGVERLLNEKREQIAPSFVSNSFYEFFVRSGLKIYDFIVRFTSFLS